jgi:hypothetical protein
MFRAFVSVWKPLPQIDSTFAHTWQAEILNARPLILPARQFVYPAEVEEVERGALEIMVRPTAGSSPFLSTCALGFADPMVPSGVWSCPDPAWFCAVAGGYAYLIDSGNPNRWEQVEYRPVTAVTPIESKSLLVFSGFHSLLAWGPEGRAWQTERLSWDGVRITAVESETLRGLGWDLKTDRELEFEVNLTTGEHSGGAFQP